MLDEHQPVLARWYRARSAFDRRQFDDCRELCRQIVEIEPAARNTRRLWGHAARRTGHHEEALVQWLHLVDGSDEPGDDDWDAIVDASALRRWDVVDRCRARLGVEPREGDRPGDERWGHAILLYAADEQRVMGLRTGPATARVVSVAPEGDRQRAGDLVVFDPAPVEPIPDDEEERATFLCTYPVVTVLDEGGCQAWTIDGVPRR